MTENPSLTVANYYREMSLNYHDHDRGVLPWPERPEFAFRQLAREAQVARQEEL